MTNPPPSGQVLAIIAALVEQRAGLHYRLGERELFADKLVAHAETAGFESLLDYYYFLRYDDHDGNATQGLVEALLVHETYFFRELQSLEVAIDHAIVPVVRTGRRARIWSAGCATGEEPLSIAVLLAERGISHQCDILATDISTAALARARQGRYRRRSLRQDGLELAARWLERDGDHVIVPRRFIDAVDWQILNLCDAPSVQALGQFDLIACRHVMIYFSESTIVDVVQSLTGRLRHGGTLLVGVSESLLRFSTSLLGEEIAGAFMYRRVS